MQLVNVIWEMDKYNDTDNLSTLNNFRADDTEPSLIRLPDDRHKTDLCRSVRLVEIIF